MSDNLPHMDYRQHRRARRLVHECCNYDEGTACYWTTGSLACASRAFPFPSCATVPCGCPALDGELAAALLCREAGNGVPSAGGLCPQIQPGKYCPDCAGRMKKIKAAERKRKQRQRCHALEPFKPA